MFNGVIISTLKQNFISNSRLQYFQIAGIQFSKDSWARIADAIGEATHLQNLAINDS